MKPAGGGVPGRDTAKPVVKIDGDNGADTDQVAQQALDVGDL